MRLRLLAGAAPAARAARPATAATRTRCRPSRDPADDFCRLACLVYSAADGPDRWAGRGGAPGRTAGPAGPVGGGGRGRGRPGGAGAPTWPTRPPPSAPTGPYRWEPLLYLIYSRVPQVDPLRAAGLLLDAGADPDAGYLWHGLPRRSPR